MQWQDKGIILSQKTWSDTQSIISIFTFDHGRHLGLIRQSKQPSAKSQLQPGNIVQVTWKGRLSEQLGRWQLETENIVWIPLIKKPKRLAALSSACGLLDKGLPERHPYPALFDYFEDFLKNLLKTSDCQRSYLQFELELLSTLGFGLTLDFCAATQTKKNLVYVSPKTGHAVCEEAGKPYADRLLRLPSFMLDENSVYTDKDFVEALHLTGFFLYRFLLEGKELPPTRLHLVT